MLAVFSSSVSEEWSSFLFVLYCLQFFSGYYHIHLIRRLNSKNAVFSKDLNLFFKISEFHGSNQNLESKEDFRMLKNL